MSDTTQAALIMFVLAAIQMLLALLAGSASESHFHAIFATLLFVSGQIWLIVGRLPLVIYITAPDVVHVERPESNNTRSKS